MSWFDRLTTNGRGVTISAALRAAAARLEATSDTARLDAELLMAHALGVTRSDLLLRHMSDPEPEGFAPLVDRRAACEPVAYVTGTQEFYGRPFVVDREVLIPRADSETVVEAALDAAPEAGRVLDCGVGSGALLLSVLAERVSAEGIGIDRSLGAMAIASRNAALHGLGERARILHADWHEPDWAKHLGRFDLILANPPYVEEDAPLDASVREFEPHSALFAGPDGLDDYRILIPQLPGLLAKGGVAVLEIGAVQAVDVAHIAGLHGFAAQLRKDLAGRDRALILRVAQD